MRETTKSLTSERQVDNALDIAGKKEKNFGRLIYSIGKSCFDNDGLQNYLIFPPIYHTFTMSARDIETTTAWKPKGLSDKIIKPTTASSNILAPLIK